MFAVGEEFNFTVIVLVDEMEGLTVFVAGEVSYYFC